MASTKESEVKDVDTAQSAPPKHSSADSGLTYRQGWNLKVLIAKISPELI
jgi:hypothetical protein